MTLAASPWAGSVGSTAVTLLVDSDRDALVDDVIVVMQRFH
jgi:hypothetical protein